MSRYKSTIIIVTLVFSFRLLNAQNHDLGFTIEGHIIGSHTTDTLVGAHITLRSLEDSTLIAGTVSDNKGFFKLFNIKKSNYLLAILHVAHLPQLHTIDIQGNVNLGEIKLTVDTVALDEVIIKTSLPKIVREPTKTIVNIGNSIYSTGENGYDLMNVVPEIRADGLGNISFRGQQDVIVYVDDRKIQLTAQQLRVYLKGIPSESIQTIEVLSVPSAQYDAEGASAIINIVTKKDHKYGLNIFLTSYYEQHRRPGFGGGLVSNYRKGIFNFHLNYNYSYFNFFNNIDQIQSFNAFEPPTTFQQEDLYKETYHDQSFETGIHLNIKRSQRVGVIYRLNHTTWDMLYNSYMENINNSSVDSVYTTLNEENEFLNDQSINLFYEIDLDTLKSQLKIDYDYIQYRNPSKAFYKTNFFIPDFTEIRPSDSSFINNPIHINIHTFKIEIDKKFKRNFDVIMGAKLSLIDTKNENKFFTKNYTSVIVDSSRTNKFIYSEDIYAAYLSLSKEWEKWNFNVGIRFEETRYGSEESATINSSFSKKRQDFFPSLFIGRKIGDMNSLNFSYGRRITRPAYEKLNPFIDYQNAYNYTTGNPDLNPAFINTVELNYLYKHQYSFTMGYTRTSDMIGEVLLNDESGLEVISTFDNLNQEDYYFVSTSVPIQVTNWWSIYSSASLYHKNILINNLNINENLSQKTLMLYGNNTFRLPKNTSIELGGYYQSNSLYNIYKVGSMGAVNLTVKKSFFNEKFNVSLNFYDLFATQNSTSVSNINQIYRKTDSKYTSRMFRINLTYNFLKGKKKVSGGERESVNQDERGRIE